MPGLEFAGWSDPAIRFNSGVVDLGSCGSRGSFSTVIERDCQGGDGTYSYTCMADGDICK